MSAARLTPFSLLKFCIFYIQRLSFLSFSLQADKIVYYNAKEDVSTTPRAGDLGPSACVATVRGHL